MILLWLTPDNFTRQGEMSQTGKGQPSPHYTVCNAVDALPSDDVLKQTINLRADSGPLKFRPYQQDALE